MEWGTWTLWVKALMKRVFLWFSSFVEFVLMYSSLCQHFNRFLLFMIATVVAFPSLCPGWEPAGCCKRIKWPL